MFFLQMNKYFIKIKKYAKVVPNLLLNQVGGQSLKYQHRLLDFYVGVDMFTNNFVDCGILRDVSNIRTGRLSEFFIERPPNI